jgi:hypothetical protein
MASLGAAQQSFMESTEANAQRRTGIYASYMRAGYLSIVEGQSRWEWCEPSN